jgi:hypothetical protein
LEHGHQEAQKVEDGTSVQTNPLGPEVEPPEAAHLFALVFFFFKDVPHPEDPLGNAND